MNGANPVSGCEAAEVALIADELSRAVEITLDPSVTQEARLHAYNACESFKENSPWCAQAGLLLASGAQYSAVVKHFGLQLMEHTVKYRWPQISQQEKLFIKENAMKLLWMGGWETGHLNDALGRVIVEMIKREWPQQWPTMLSELSDACARGHAHTQIVLHVFLRLVEDVATLQTLEQHQRRKDIYQALTSNMHEIFAFFLRLIEMHVQEFREKTAAGDYTAGASNGRVVQVVLLTLTGFVEWVSVSHIVANNGRLLQILCVLLQDDVFQVPAAECLLQIVNRKGPTKDRKPLMILFSEDAITCIHRAAVECMNAPDDKHYLFLKKLSQVIAGLGQQLTSLWSLATGVDSWLPLFLETLLALTGHPSLTIVQAANSVWLALFRHETVARLPHLLAVVPRYLHTAAPKALKVAYPSRRPPAPNDPAAYVSLDYDSEEEFAAFFAKFRTELLDSFRHIMTVAPLVTWSYVEQWTGAALDKAAACPRDLDAAHPLYVEWEALSQVLEVVQGRIVAVEPRPSVASGLALLERCVRADPASPLLLSLLLSLVSALFVFLSCASCQLAGPGVGTLAAELLPLVLDKVFAALVYTRGGEQPTPASRSRDVKNVRRHAAGLLVKLAVKYPLVLLPVFGRLQMAARALMQREALSALESVTLQEALLLVANHFANYERQSALVQEVLGDSASRWAELAPHVGSGAALARLVGLHAPPAEHDAPHDAQRRTLAHAVALLLGVVRRVQIPDDPDKASRGGFSAGVTPSGNPIWRNPCGAHVVPLLSGVLSLCGALHELHACGPASWHAGHARALELPAAELHALLGRRERDAAEPAHPAQRMQCFLHTLHENVCAVVGCAAASLGRELYGAAGACDALVGALLRAAHRLPDYRLRPVVRHALRPLLHHCPPAHYRDLALPLMHHLAPFMLNHLSARWEYITGLYESGKFEEEDSNDTREVIEDMVLRQLTKEYLELLKVCLIGGSLEGGAGASPHEMEEESGTCAGGAAGAGGTRAPDHVSELGALVLAERVAGGAALHTLLQMLWWGDSAASLRACSLAGACVRGALAAGGVGAGEACGALAAVLHALRTHGMHDANQAALLALAVQVYEAVRPLHPAVAQVLRAVPGADAADVQRLDDKVLPAAAAAGAPTAPAAKHAKHDKSKRELLKKITQRLIGRNVGQLFKKEMVILDLPKMSVPKEKPPSALDTAGCAGLDSLFAPQAPT